MHAADLTPNAVTFSALINACCKSLQIERAFQIFSEMKASGLTPNVVTYTTLIDGCAKARLLPRALEVFRQMVKSGIAPNRITCHALFHGFLKEGEVRSDRSPPPSPPSPGRETPCPLACQFVSLSRTVYAVFVRCA